MPNPKNMVAHRYKPDESGNRNGRPKKIPCLDELLASVLCEINGDVTAVEIILKALRAKACEGDLRAAEVLLDRAYGRVKQQIDHAMQARPCERTIDDQSNKHREACVLRRNVKRRNIRRLLTKDIELA